MFFLSLYQHPQCTWLAEQKFSWWGRSSWVVGPSATPCEYIDSRILVSRPLSVPSSPYWGPSCVISFLQACFTWNVHQSTHICTYIHDESTCSLLKGLVGTLHTQVICLIAATPLLWEEIIITKRKREYRNLHHVSLTAEREGMLITRAHVVLFPLYTMMSTLPSWTWHRNWSK